MFSTRRYAEVKKRAERQNEIFAELIARSATLDEVDFDRAAELVGRLSPLPAPV